MANLTNKQIKDGYPNILTIGDTTQENPTTGEVQNGVGSAITGLNVSGNIDATGDVSATNLSGDGSQITNLNADNLASGTVPDARFPATLPAASGENLTGLNATNLASGTVPDARFPATLPAANGSALTNLNADNLATGTVSNDRVAGLYTWMTQPVIQISWNTNYFNLADNQDNLIPFDAQDHNTSTSTFEFVNSGTSDARILVKEAGLYEVYSRMHFYDLTGNVDILVRLMTSFSSTGIMTNETLLNDKKFAEQTGDQLMLGYAIVDLAANTYINVAMHPNANQPYPSNTESTPSELIIKKISTPSYALPLNLNPIIFDGLEYYEVRSATGRIWLDRNLGATQVATAYNDNNSYGDLYQWGRASDGHQLRSSSTTSTLATTSAPNTGGSWDGKFILPPSAPYDWLLTTDDNLWQGVSGVNLHAPSGFRLPTHAEWQLELQSWGTIDRDGAFNSPLKLPVGGDRNMINGTIGNAGNNGEYWSSTTSGTAAKRLSINSSSAGTSNTYRGVGCSVRLIKD